MKRIFLFLSVLLLFVLLTGCFLFPGTEEETAPDRKNDTALTEPDEVLAGINGAATAEGEMFDPVLIPSLIGREFNGDDLSLVNVLDDNTYYTRYHVTYMSDHLTVSGIMNIPKGEGPFPVAFLNHGHIDTSVYTNGRGLKREQDYLARNGLAVFHSDYRNHAQSDKDDSSETRLRLGYAIDVINAIYALKRAGLEMIDTDTIFMLGHSMGGGVAITIMVTQPELVNAYVLFAPVHANFQYSFERWIERRPVEAERIVSAYGTFEANPDFWRNMNAENFFSNVDAPVLVHHGTEDSDVPLSWSEDLEEGLRKAGKDVALYTYKGEPHEFINAWPLVMRRTLDFFRSNRRGEAL